MKIIFQILEPIVIDITEDNQHLFISEIKSRISSQYSIDKNIYLIYCGKNLLNSKRISDYQINNNSCLQSFIENTEVVEENNQSSTLPSSPNVNSDNVNIMYEFSLGGPTFSSSRFSTNTNNNIQLSDIFSLISNISRDRSRTSRASRNSSRTGYSTFNTNTTRESNFQENRDTTSINNDNQRRTDESSNSQTNNTSRNPNNDNLQELWELLNNLVSGQSNLRSVINYLHQRGLNIPEEQLEQFINNISLQNGNRLSVLSSLITILKSVSENRVHSPLSTEFSNTNTNHPETSDYSDLIPQIKEMGFYDDQMIMDALIQSKGNLNLTTETLLNRIKNAT